MKKFLSILTLFLVALIAIGAAGCLDGDDDKNITTNNTSPGVPAAPIEGLDKNTVTVDPLPQGFTNDAIVDIVNNGDIIGVTDPLVGYSGYYRYNGSNVYLSAYACEDEQAVKSYIGQMKNETGRLQGEVKEIGINGHDATLLTIPQITGGDKTIIAWNAGDVLIVVNGPAGYDGISKLATASGL